MKLKPNVHSLVIRYGCIFVLFCLTIQVTYCSGISRGGNDPLSNKRQPDTVKRNDVVILVSDSFDLFLRETNKGAIIYAGNGDSIKNELWIRYKSAKKEELLVECKDDEDPKKMIVDISDVVLSLDQQIVYFMCSAWATSAAIHKVDLRTKKEFFVCDGNYLQVIQKGKYKGKLLVNQHRYHKNQDLGSYDWYYIVDDSGKVLKIIGESIPEGFE
jgi:hypothetical protein